MRQKNLSSRIFWLASSLLAAFLSSNLRQKFSNSGENFSGISKCPLFTFSMTSFCFFSVSWQRPEAVNGGDPSTSSKAKIPTITSHRRQPSLYLTKCPEIHRLAVVLPSDNLRRNVLHSSYAVLWVKSTVNRPHSCGTSSASHHRRFGCTWRRL